MDKEMEVIPGTGKNTDGALFYHVEARCDIGIQCPRGVGTAAAAAAMASADSRPNLPPPADSI